MRDLAGIGVALARAQMFFCYTSLKTLTEAHVQGSPIDCEQAVGTRLHL